MLPSLSSTSWAQVITLPWSPELGIEVPTSTKLLYEALKAHPLMYAGFSKALYIKFLLKTRILNIRLLNLAKQTI